MRRSARLASPPLPVAAPVAARRQQSASCATLECDVDKLRCSAGQEIEPTKAPVVRWMLKETKAGGVQPRFNRISGLLEWANAVVLWVNIDDDSKYRNCFVDDGQSLRLSWYGSSRHAVDSPVIDKMLRLADQGACFLFCRYQGGYYFNCGRLARIAVDAEAERLRVDWLLVDRDAMLERLQQGGVAHPFSYRLANGVYSEPAALKDEPDVIKPEPTETL